MDEVRFSRWQKRVLMFFVSQSITLFGSTLVQMALVWYATMQTASGRWVAAFSVCSYLPQFLMAFVGGVWADRYSHKRLIIAADAVIAGLTLAMVGLMPLFTSEAKLLATLLVLSLLRAVAAGVQTPAVNAVVPQMVPKHALLRVNGINASMQAVVNFAAPAAAGAVMAFGSLRAILMIDVVTAAAGISLLAVLALPKRQTEKEDTALWRSMLTGVKAAFSKRDLRQLLLGYGAFTFFCVPAGFLAGLYVRRTFGASYWILTVVELVGFAGMLGGGVLMSIWGGFQNRWRTLMVSLFIFGGCAVWMGVVTQFTVYLAVMVLYGIAMTSVQTVITTLLQEQAPPRLQGRILGLQNSMYAGALPFGMAVFGPLADHCPLSLLMVFSGLAVIALGLLLWRCSGDKKHAHWNRR